MHAPRSHLLIIYNISYTDTFTPHNIHPSSVLPGIRFSLAMQKLDVPQSGHQPSSFPRLRPYSSQDVPLQAHISAQRDLPLQGHLQGHLLGHLQGHLLDLLLGQAVVPYPDH